MSPHTHLMYDEYGREGRVWIRDVECDGFTMKRPKNRLIGVVDKYKFLNLILMNTWHNKDKSNSHLDSNG